MLDMPDRSPIPVDLNPANQAEVAVARSGIYGMLTRIYDREIDEIFIQTLCTPAYTDALKNIGLSTIDLLSSPMPELLVELSIDYTHLFIGPGQHISPHESVHRYDENSQLWGESTVAVKNFIESQGFTYPSSSMLIPDHVSVEMGFMQVLTLLEAKAWEVGDDDSAWRGIQTEQKFIDEHLIQWIPNFCNQVTQLAACSFYRGMAKLTQEFIQHEAEEFRRHVSH